VQQVDHGVRVQCVTTRDPAWLSQLLDAIYAGQSFPEVLKTLGLTANRVRASPRPTGTGREAGGRPDGNPPGRYEAR
jgi:hypothetical protein